MLKVLAIGAGHDLAMKLLSRKMMQNFLCVAVHQGGSGNPNKHTHAIVSKDCIDNWNE